MVQYVPPHGESWVEITRVDRSGRASSPTLATIDLADGVLSGASTDVEVLERVFSEWLQSRPADEVDEYGATYRLTAWWQYSGLPIRAVQFHSNGTH